MPAIGGAACAPQHELPAHEFTIVFADCAASWLETRIWQIGRASELPAIAEQLVSAVWRRRGGAIKLVSASRVMALRNRFPFEFGRQSCARPGRKSVRLKIGNMRYWSIGIAACQP